MKISESQLYIINQYKNLKNKISTSDVRIAIVASVVLSAIAAYLWFIKKQPAEKKLPGNQKEIVTLNQNAPKEVVILDQKEPEKPKVIRNDNKLMEEEEKFHEEFNQLKKDVDYYLNGSKSVGENAIETQKALLKRIYAMLQVCTAKYTSAKEDVSLHSSSHQSDIFTCSYYEKIYKEQKAILEEVSDWCDRVDPKYIKSSKENKDFNEKNPNGILI